MPNRLDELPARGLSKAFTLDQANELAQAMYGRDARVERWQQAERLVIDFKAIHFGQAQLLKVNLEGLSVERSTDDFLHVSIPLAGSFRRATRASAQEFDGMRKASIGRPFDRSKLEVAGASVLVFYAPRSVVIERAERLTGTAQNDGARLSDVTDSLDLSTPISAALARHLKSALAEMTHLNAIGAGALAARATEEILINMMTAALFPGVARTLAGSHVDRSPALVRRARDYIKAHAHEPIEISKLAADLGISLRSLQENFQRYLGYSPRELILECRLDRARDRLLTDDDGLTVTTVALDSGFSDLGQFSAKYRAKFGELPSQTLRRVRGD